MSDPLFPLPPAPGSTEAQVTFYGPQELDVTFEGGAGIDVDFQESDTPALEIYPALIGPPGPAGAGGSTFEQSFAADTQWIVNHNLGRYPSVTVRSVGGQVVEAEVNHVSGNQLTISFSGSFAGSVYCV